MKKLRKSKVPLLGASLTCIIIGSLIFYFINIISWKLVLSIMAIVLFIALVITLPYIIHGTDSGYLKIHRIRYIGVLFSFIMILLLLFAE